MSAQSSVAGGNPKKADESGYVVVARRYRPRNFDQLVGQDHVAQALRGAIETHRVGHAYLFTGARGVGKTSTARIFAKALNDPAGPTTHPSDDNDVAQAIDAGEDVDVIEIDGASNRGIDEIRSLRANVGVRPSRSRYKIYIIDEVHMLTGAAFNALLKTLEEPPEHVKFIFCTTDPEKIPITVLSRCQRFDFAPVENDKIVARLREIVEAEAGSAEDEALELLARRAAGSMRDSQSLLEQVLSFTDGKLTAASVHSMLGTADDQRLHALATALAQRDAAAALRQIDDAMAEGIDAGRLAEQMLGYFRDLMTLAVGCDAAMMRYAATSMAPAMRELSDGWGLQTVLAIVGLVDQTITRIRLSVYARVLLESTVIQICHLPDLQSLADLASAASAAATSAAGGEKKKSSVGRRLLTHPDPIPDADAKPGSINGRTADNINDDSSDPPASPANSPPDNADVAFAASSPVADANATSRRGDEPTGGKGNIQSANVPRLPDGGDPIDENVLQNAWNQILTEIDPMVATLVRSSKSVRVAEPGHISIEFPSNAALAMSRCGKPEYKEELTRTIRRVTGRTAQINLHIDQSPPPPLPAPMAKSRPQNRMQRMKEIESNPLIHSCIDLLGAEIVRIDAERS